MRFVMLVLVLASVAVCTLPAEAQNDSLLVSTAWLAEHLDDPSVVVLQVDGEGLYNNGHIPGTRFIGHMAFVGSRDGTEHQMASPARIAEAFERVGVSDDSRVVIYGAPLSAARAFITLEYIGMRGRVALLDGGMARWRAEGRPISTADPEIERGALAPRPRADVVVTADWVVDRLDDQHVALVDARPDREWERGRIPGAGRLYWRWAMEGEGEIMLRSVSELRRLFVEAGHESDQTMVSYCAIGLRASMVYFVARYLGYDARMYDGSWSEWSRLGDVPIER